MFECPKCGKDTLDYYSKTHTYICSNKDCGYIEIEKPQKTVCCYCGKEFERYNWFTPSACPYCNHSFVD